MRVKQILFALLLFIFMFFSLTVSADTEVNTLIESKKVTFYGDALANESITLAVFSPDGAICHLDEMTVGEDGNYYFKADLSDEALGAYRVVAKSDNTYDIGEFVLTDSVEKSKNTYFKEDFEATQTGTYSIGSAISYAWADISSSSNSFEVIENSLDSEYGKSLLIKSGQLRTPWNDSMTMKAYKYTLDFSVALTDSTAGLEVAFDAGNKIISIGGGSSKLYLYQNKAFSLPITDNTMYDIHIDVFEKNRGTGEYLMNVYVDGIKLNVYPISFKENLERINSVTFWATAGNNGGGFIIDNIIAKTIADYEYTVGDSIILGETTDNSIDLQMNEPGEEYIILMSLENDGILKLETATGNYEFEVPGGVSALVASGESIRIISGGGVYSQHNPVGEIIIKSLQIDGTTADKLNAYIPYNVNRADVLSVLPADGTNNVVSEGYLDIRLSNPVIINENSNITSDTCNIIGYELAEKTVDTLRIYYDSAEPGEPLSVCVNVEDVYSNSLNKTIYYRCSEKYSTNGVTFTDKDGNMLTGETAPEDVITAYTEITNNTGTTSDFALICVNYSGGNITDIHMDKKTLAPYSRGDFTITGDEINPETKFMVWYEPENQIMPVEKVHSLPVKDILYAEGSKLYLNGEEFRAIGMNSYDLFLRILSDYTDSALLNYDDEYDTTWAEHVFAGMQARGFDVLRVFMPAYSESVFKEIYNGVDKEKYYAAFDKLLDLASEYDVKLIPTLCWNMSAFADSCMETNYILVTDPQSESRKLLYEYISDVVSKYSGRTEIAMWEIGNEFNLNADLKYNFQTHFPQGNRYTTRELAAFYKETAELIKSCDPYHLIITGDSAPRFAQYNLLQGAENGYISWSTDTYEQQKEIISMLNDDERLMLSVHYYNDGQRLLTMEDCGNISAELGKPMIIGEIGAYNSSWTEDGIYEKLSAQLDAIIDNGISIALYWQYEYPSGGNATMLEGVNDDLIELIAQANHKIKSMEE